MRPVALMKERPRIRFTGDIWASGDEEGCITSVFGEIVEVDLEAYWEFSSDRRVIRRCNDAR
jgi:hypothetical protein